jgi:hypothetical protein
MLANQEKEETCIYKKNQIQKHVSNGNARTFFPYELIEQIVVQKGFIHLLDEYPEDGDDQRHNDEDG